MNLKGLPEKIGQLTGLIQDVVDNLEALVEVNQKMFVKLEMISGNLSELIEKFDNERLDKKDTCKKPENPV